MAKATVTLALAGPNLSAVYSGDTGANKKNRGMYHADWSPDLANGVYTAEVTGLTHADYTWDRALDPIANVADADGDTLPDQQHSVPH